MSENESANPVELGREWMTDFLKHQWSIAPTDPFGAFHKCAGELIPVKDKETGQWTESTFWGHTGRVVLSGPVTSISVSLGVNANPDDEGTYSPAAYYTVQAEEFYFCTEDDGDYWYGPIQQLDDCYAGPSVSIALRKNGYSISMDEDYSVEFEMSIDLAKADEVERASSVSFDAYLACFSFEAHL